MNIVFDTQDWLLNPAYGLYHFAFNLGKALNEELKQIGIQLYIYGSDSNPKAFGSDYSYIHQKRGSRFFLWLEKKHFPIWHSCSQLNRTFPKSGQKVVLTVHDLNFLYEIHNAKEQKKILTQLQKNIDRSDFIVAISQYVQQDIKKYLNVEGKKLRTIHNGCNLYFGELIQPKDKLGDFIYTIGTIQHKKNFHVLPCLIRNNHYKLVISGVTCEEDYFKRIVQEAEKYGVKDRVIFTGSIDEPTKQWYLKNCRAFVFPSICEGFGLPVLEAMQYGKKVFLSDHTSLPEIGGNKAYYFDHEFKTEKMINLFEEKIKDSVDSETIIKYAKSFSWVSAAKKYIKIYNEL
jgi:glycosyltransferase involved in cell wall biosynthesis